MQDRWIAGVPLTYYVSLAATIHFYFIHTTQKEHAIIRYKLQPRITSIGSLEVEPPLF